MKAIVRLLPCRSAFTLTEMLVVISIIAILCNLLLPTLVQAMGSARQTSCAHAMKNISVASFQYLDDWHFFPASSRNRTSYLPAFDYWATEIRPYCDDKLPGFSGTNGTLYCPVAKELSSSQYTYSANLTMMQGPGFAPVPIAYFTKPGKTIYLFDSSVGWTSIKKTEFDPATGSAPAPLFHQNRDNYLFIDGHVNAYPYFLTANNSPDWWTH